MSSGSDARASVVDTSDLVARISRRVFLRGLSSSAGGLVLVCLLPAVSPAVARSKTSDAAVSLGPVVRIGSDGVVTLMLEKVEMGQGVHTALAQLVAEELEVAWEQIRVETLGLEGRTDWINGTFASLSVRSLWKPLRTAGAAAREMLVEAAAAQWGVSRETCTASRGVVTHRETGRSLSYAQLAQAAAALAVPQQVSLKASSDFDVIGRSLPRVELREKVTGDAVFGIDVKLDGMLHAAIAMSPVECGKLLAADRASAELSSGVRAVVDLPGAIAVVADHYWQARAGLAVLAPQFETGDARDDSDAYAVRLGEALQSPGVRVFAKSDPAVDGIEPARVMNAYYDVPLLAHATMEPMNCTASFADGRCEFWVSTQAVSRARQAVADALEILPEAVTVHPTLLGGGLGRRVESDFCVQASLIARAVGRPVKLIWSREDDIRHDWYRPACAGHLEASLDADGRPLGLRLHTAGPWYDRELPRALRDAVGWAEKRLEGPLAPRSLPDAIWWHLPKVARSGVNGIVAGGGSPFPYRVGTQRREYSLVECGVRIGWWRSVAASQGAFFTECFIDELAGAAGVDPLSYRREMLDGRGLAVLERAAEMAQWSLPRPAGVGLGIAYQQLFDSFVCQVAEVSVDSDKAIEVRRVWCAVDCGIAVNPDGVRAQMEGGIVFGLGSALQEEIRVARGRVVQSNFHDYHLLRFEQTPQIEVDLVPSGADPGGVGELGTPGVAPAVANAVFAVTGRRIRSLPILPLA